jgi:putative endonuclease
MAKSDQIPNPHKEDQQEEAEQQSHFVYMLRCADETLYTGYTNDIPKRLAKHNAGKGARYTRARLPVTLLASWSFSTKGQALRAEFAIKSLPRSHKLRLIEELHLGLQLRLS